MWLSHWDTQTPEKLLGIMCEISTGQHVGVYNKITRGANHSPLHPQTVFIQEPGLYQLIFSSKLASASEFQDWVFEDVPPSIRKTGNYTIPCALKTIKSITCDDLTALDDDERKEYKQILKVQHNMIKLRTRKKWRWDDFVV
jgi:hypothetical protein